MSTIPTDSRIAVTTGDPAGVGPEIVAHLFSKYTPEYTKALIIGADSVLRPWLDRWGAVAPVVSSPDDIQGDTPVVVLDTGVGDAVETGVDSTAGGRHAGRAIEVACELVNNRSVGAVVTAPISKNSLNLANFRFPGHTEMLARYLYADNVEMMMVHGALRVVPLTRHLPLADVAANVTHERITTCVRAVHRGLREQFRVETPRIAVAGLNPHAGDGGVIGHEELRTIVPALDALRDEGIDVTGPHPADAMFQAAASGTVDADTYIAMYHDQGLIPFKMAAQRRGVNVTLGLAVPRTSVDHGTAFDIAGRGIAETESLLEAYKLAETLMA